MRRVTINISLHWSEDIRNGFNFEFVQGAMPHRKMEILLPNKLVDLSTKCYPIISFRHAAVLVHINQEDYGYKHLRQGYREKRAPLPVKFHCQPEMKERKKNDQVLSIYSRP